jgi:pimeloyl-ACP methyl ester carboxylesterase
MGNEDPAIPVEHADYFVSSISDSRFQLMRNCGHTPYVEEPRKFFKIVMDFLNED